MFNLNDFKGGTGFITKSDAQQLFMSTAVTTLNLVNENVSGTENVQTLNVLGETSLNNVSVTGNTVLGSDTTDTVTVNAPSTFNTNLSVKDTMNCKNDATGIAVQFKCQPYVTSQNDTTSGSSDYALTTKKYVDTNCAKILTDANTVSGGKNFTGGITVRYMMSANDTGVNFTTLPTIASNYITTATSATNCIATKGYVDASSLSALDQSKGYADVRDVNTLTIAKTYTDDMLTKNNIFSGTNKFTDTTGYNRFADLTVDNMFRANVNGVLFTTQPSVASVNDTTSSSSDYALSTKKYVDTSLVTGKAYTDTQITASNTSATSGDTTTLTTAKTYADLGDTTTLTNAKTFATTGDTATLASAKAYADNKVVINNGSAVYSQTTATSIGNPVFSETGSQSPNYLTAPYLGTQTTTNTLSGASSVSAFTVSFFCNFVTNNIDSNSFTPKTAILDFRHYYTCMNAYVYAYASTYQTNSIQQYANYNNSDFAISTASTASGVTTFGSNYIEGHVVVTLFKGTITKKLLYAPSAFLETTGLKKIFQSSYGTAKMSFYPFECTYVSDTSFRVDVQFPNQANNPLTANWISSCGFSCEVKCSKLKTDSVKIDTLKGTTSVGSMGDAVLSLTTA